MIIRDDIPLGYTFDENGRILTCKCYTGYWHEWTYDSNGNILTFKDSYGYWRGYTYDSNGNILTFKDSRGSNRIIICYGKYYNLAYDLDSKKYAAGCQSLTYDEAVEFYEKYADNHLDSYKFMKAIEKHHQTGLLSLTKE